MAPRAAAPGRTGTQAAGPGRRSPARRPPAPARTQRGLAIASALALLAGLQLTQVWGRLPAPFVDTRLHYHWDNAFASFCARNGNRNVDLRSQFGVTLNTYDAWGERVGAPRYYTDHPFLVKALFQQVARLVGYDEWTSRSFYALVSFAIVAAVFVAVLQASGSVLAAVAAGATLLSLPLFATYQVCAKYELDGMLVGAWYLVALGRCLERPGRATAIGVGVLAALAPLAHWTALLATALAGAWLLVGAWHTRESGARKALIATIAGGAAGTFSLLALMAWLQGGIRGAWAPLGEAFARRSAPIGAGAWLARQWTYLQANLDPVFLLAALVMAAWLAAAQWRAIRSGASNRGGGSPHGAPLVIFSLVTLATGVVWIAVFRQGSFIHVYWQFWLTLPAAALVGAFVALARSRPSLLAVVVLALLALLVRLHDSGAAAYAGIVADQLGTSAETEFLRSLRNDRFTRFAFIPLVQHPLNGWPDNPLFLYYTDRPVRVLGPNSVPAAGEKALLLRVKNRESVVARIEALGGARLANEKCGERLCAYDVLPR